MAEIYGEETTSYGEVDTSKTDLETIKTETLDALTQIAGADIKAPAPADLVKVDIAKKAVTQNVTATTITAPADVTYTKITTDMEVTNASLNQTAETLKASVNTAIASLVSKVESSVSGAVSSTNSALSNIKVQMDDQTVEVDNKLDTVVDRINTALLEVRTANQTQSNDVATSINKVSAELLANINKVKAIADDAQSKIQQLDDVYLSDEDFAQRVTAVNELLETLRGADFDIIGAIQGSVSELNGMLKVRRKNIVMNNTSGVYAFNIVAEGMPELADTNYGIEVQATAVVGGSTRKVSVDVENKTATGFDIIVESKGVHFLPQPHDGSANAVTINVVITHEKLNPLTFEVDALDDAWLTSGNGTDTIEVPVVEEDTPAV